MSNKSLIENLELLKLSNEESNKLTKECLQKSLLILMKKKEFKEITITEIVNKAGVSRTAFYRNYKTKEDILNNLFNEMIEKIYKVIVNRGFKENEYMSWLTIFSELKNNTEQLRIIFKAGMFENIENSIYQFMLKEYKNPTMQDKLVEKFWSNAVCGILKEWALNYPNESIENIANYMCKIV